MNIGPGLAGMLAGGAIAVAACWLPLFRSGFRHDRVSVATLATSADGGRTIWSAAVVCASVAVTIGLLVATLGRRRRRDAVPAYVAGARTLGRATAWVGSVSAAVLVVVAVVAPLRTRGTATSCFGFYGGSPSCVSGRTSDVPTFWFGLLVPIVLGAAALGLRDVRGVSRSPSTVRRAVGQQVQVSSVSVGALLCVGSVVAPAYGHSSLGGRWWGGWHSALLIIAAVSAVLAVLGAALQRGRGAVAPAVSTIGFAVAAGLVPPATDEAPRLVTQFGEAVWVAPLWPTWGYLGALVGSVAILAAVMSMVGQDVGLRGRSSRGDAISIVAG